ncbi:MAG TPA: hypothetical protein VME92_03290 [Acetobacteraceae bacterium]|nr:hypothetical protein [Acetobacteraceae bacterium]
MVQLALLLLGLEAVQRHWLPLATIGAAWGLLGALVIIDPLDGVQNITLHTLGFLLVIEGASALLALLVSAAKARLVALRSVALILAGLMIIETPWRNLMLVSILFGLGLLVDGTVRAISTLLVRFPGWRIALVATGIELVLAVLALAPWPVSYEATVPFCVGIALILSGWTVLRSAILLRDLPPDAPITSLPIFEHERGWHLPVTLPPSDDNAAETGERMIVHVWTPLASATDPRRRPLLDRYVAAVDRRGTVSTGHAALEMPPDLYISHYRAEELDRSGLEFRQALHAGRQNDVSGRFLPSYAGEAAEWCDSTARVAFHNFSAARLRAFWAAYRQDPTYNLTNRNCSVVVAMALDAALEGVLGEGAVWSRLLRLILHPDLILATVLRKRAQTMTWTPGLVLDYARSLRRVVEPPETPWIGVLRQAIARYRQLRRQRLHGAAPEAASASRSAVAARPGDAG